jgi:hypothetical protein
MSSVFPPWSNTAIRIAIVVVLLGGAGSIVGPMIFVRTPWRRGQFESVDQPVAFDHRHHVRDDGIDCAYCHSSAWRTSTAGIPSTDLCMGCHSQVWNQSPMLEPVRRSYFSGKPIPWNRVHRLPDFVFFNHSIHVNKGVGCVTCHGRVDEMPAVYQTVSLTMSWCLTCHRAPEGNLRPRAEITNMAWDPGRERGPIGRQVAAELAVRSVTNCTACHR